MDIKLTSPSLLVASPQLQDSNFNHGVILLVDHRPESAFGLVINRPSKVPVAAIIKDGSSEMPTQIPSWEGGPVGRDMGLILSFKRGAKHTPTVANTPKEIIADDILLSSSKEALSEMVIHAQNFYAADIAKLRPTPSSTDPILIHPYRFIVGYAGWGAGQLDEEIRYGTWIQLPLDLDVIFNTTWQTMWQTAIGRLGITPDAIAPSVQQYLN